MKIILDSEDITKLIKDKYSGAEVVEVDPKILVTVSIDLDKMMSKSKPHSTPIQATPTTPMPPEEARKRGVMSAGGRERTIQHIG